MIDKLLALQDHDIRIRDMETELADIPARKELEMQRLDQHREELSEAEEALKHSQASIHELEVEADANREKITKLRQQQMQLKTNQEFKAMESEIAKVESDIRAIEDKELVQMDELERSRAVVEEKRAALADEDAMVQRDVEAWSEREAGLNADIAAERREREELLSGIEASDLLAEYQLVQGKKDRALVPVDEGVCGGCHMHLPPYVVHEVRRKVFGRCDFCGRLLYLTAAVGKPL